MKFEFGFALLVCFGINVSVANAKDVLTYPIKEVPRNLDPHKLEDINTMLVTSQCNRGLFKFGPNLEVVGELAEKWEFTNNGLTLAIKLRPAKFNDGKPITAADVDRSIRRVFALKSGIATDLMTIKGAAQAYKTGNPKSLVIRGIADDSLEIDLEKKSPLILVQMAVIDLAVFPKDAEKQVVPFGSGSGPYFVTETDPNHLTLKLNPNYWNFSKSSADTVKFVRVSQDQISKQVETEKFDSLDGYFFEKGQVDHLLKNGWRSTVSSIARSASLLLHDSVPIKIRRLVYNRITAADLKLPFGNYKRSYGIISWILPGSLANKPDLGDSPAKFNGIPSLRKVPYKVILLDSDPTAQDLFIEIAKAVKDDGIELKPITLRFPEYIKKLQQRDYDMLMWDKTLDYPDGYSDLSYFRSATEMNRFGVADKKIDRMLDTASGEFDPGKRVQLYRDIQKEILSKYVYVPLIHGGSYFGLWSNQIKNVPAHPLGAHSLSFEDIH